MRFLMIRIATAILVLLLVIVPASTDVFADPTDTGTIQVFGTVPPLPTSIITHLSVSPSGQEIHQNQVMSYTVAYSSSNAGNIPLTLEAEWSKGTVFGASEANVDAVSYVVGSASDGYGSTPAIVDTFNKRIRWNIPALPSGAGTQSVSFQLRTTANYTGPLKVSVPVMVKVISPAGVGDKSVSFNYEYLVPVVSPDEEDTNPSTSPLATSLPSPSADVVTTGQIPSTIRVVTISAVGKTSAKLNIKTAVPAAVRIEYGTSPSFFGSSIEESVARAEHEVFITNLLPQTQYYFTVIPLDGSGAYPSDIFTFTTASDSDLDVLRKVSTITVSQSRAVLFSGSTPSLSEEAVPPIAVVKNTVIDLSLSIPNSEEVALVEAEVRPLGVLGQSTAVVNSDDFQSLSTKMTKISHGVYVGKLRTPVTPGRYQLTSRIEDIYGNLSEDEIGTMYVTAPMTVFNAKNNDPIEHAELTFYIFNQQTQLYELVSNVTTAVDNPLYTDRDGTVDLHLHPAKYKAEVIAAGFAPRTVEFDIGAHDIQDFPQVGLEPTGGVLTASFGFTSRTVKTEWDTMITHFRELSRSENFYALLVGLDIALVLATALSLWLRKRRQLLHRQVAQNHIGLRSPIPLFVAIESGKFLVNFFISYTLWLSYFFTLSLGWGRGLLIFSVSMMAICLWVKLIWETRFRN